MSDSYLVQPKGQGTAYRFRMRTPAALRGLLDPRSGRPFGSTIRRGLGSTRDIREARTRAAILRGQFLALASNPLGLSDERALVWAELVSRQRAGLPVSTGDAPDLGDLVQEEAERDARLARKAALPRSAASTRAAQRETFLAIASGTRGLPLDKLLADYLAARSPGNRTRLRPLALTGQLRVATGMGGPWCSAGT